MCYRFGGNLRINNSDTYVYMGGMDLETAISVSKRLNQPLEDVLHMPVGKQYIFRRGEKPIVTQRYDILQDEIYLEVMEENKKKGYNRGMFSKSEYKRILHEVLGR